MFTKRKDESQFSRTFVGNPNSSNVYDSLGEACFSVQLTSNLALDTIPAMPANPSRATSDLKAWIY
jgi:hypothetical protein